MKRITRLQVNVFDGYGDISLSYKWTRGTEIIHTIWDKWIKIRSQIGFSEFMEMVRSCRENSNVIREFEDRSFVEVRRWSYHRKK